MAANMHCSFISAEPSLMSKIGLICEASSRHVDAWSKAAAPVTLDSEEQAKMNIPTKNF